MQLSPVAVVDSGVDYLTVTYKPERANSRLVFYLSKCESQEKANGGITRPWGMSGYLGFRCGGLEFGNKNDGVLVRLSGFTAQRWWRRFGKLASNCSRIDVQQTFVYEEEPEKTINRRWREMRSWWLANPHRPKPKVIAGPLGGETIYSGKRVSNVFLRCYHRGTQKGMEQFYGHIRFEAELKGSHAKQMLAQLLPDRHVEPRIAATVSQMFSGRGCATTTKHADPYRLRYPITTSTAQQRLAWLRDGVRPAVLELIALGYGNEVLSCLGLVDDASPNEANNN